MKLNNFTETNNEKNSYHVLEIPVTEDIELMTGNQEVVGSRPDQFN